MRTLPWKREALPEIEAQLPDGTTAIFPGDTPDHVIQATVNKMLGKVQETPRPGVDPNAGGALHTINKGIASTLGAPVDLVNAGLNKLGAGTDEPIAGSQSIARLFGSLGVPGFETEAAQTAREYDISTKGAPLEAQFMGSLAGGGGVFTGDDGKTLADTLDNALTSNYGQPVKTYKLRGETVFNDPSQGGKPTLVNKPGPDLGDAARFAGPAIAMAPELAGAVAGGVAGTAVAPGPGTVAGTMGGAGVGAFIGELARLAAGNVAGVNNDDIIKQALENSGWATAGVGAGELVFRLGRNFLDARNGNTMAAKEFAKMLDSNQGEVTTSQQAVRGMNDLGGPKVKPTLGQMTNDAEVLSLEKELMGTPGVGAKLREATAQNQKNATATGNIVGKEFDQPQMGDKSTFSQNVQRDVGAPVRNQREQLNYEATVTEDALKKAAADATKDAAPREQVGATLRSEVVAPEESVSFAKVGEEYKKIEQVPGVDKIKVQPENYSAVINKQLDEAKKSIAPAARLEDDSAAASAKNRIDKMNEAPESQILDAKGKPIQLEPSEGMSLKDINNDLSSLRSLKRKVQTGAVPNRSEGSVNAQLSALKADRDLAIEASNNPELVEQLAKAEAARRVHGDKFERSIIGKVLQKKDGAYRVPDERVFEKLIMKDTQGNSDVFLDILDKPQYGAQKVAAKRGLEDLYHEKVISVDGDVRRESHRRFMSDYGHAIERLYGKEEAKKFANVGALANYANQARAIEKQTLAKLKKTFRAEVNDMDPSSLYNAVGKDPIKIRQLKEIVEKDHPDIWKHFQSLKREDLIGDIQERSTTSQDMVFSYKKLDNLLSDKGSQSELLLTFGKKYVDELTAFRDGLKVLQRQHLSVVSHEQNPINDAMRVIFAPLSARGRAFTAVRKVYRNETKEKVAEILADPDKLADLNKLMKRRKSEPAYAGLVASLAAWPLMMEPEVVASESTE